MKEGRVRLYPNLPLMAVMMERQRSLEVALTKIIFLKNDDGRRLLIGIEVTRVVTHHAGEGDQCIGRDDVLLVGDPHSLKIVAVLPLAGLLLQKLIRDEEAGKLMTHVDAEAIPRGEVALISDGEVTEGSGIGEVFRDDRIEVVSGRAAGCAGAECVAAPYLLQLTVRGGGVIAATGEYELPVEAGIGLAARIELDDPSHFSAVLGGISGSVDADRIQVVGSDLRAEAWRAVVREGYAVDHELRLIFGAARMKDGVAFVEPSWLRVDQVLNGTSGQRGETLLYLLRADLHHRGRVVRIYQGGSVLHGHVRQDRSKSELDIFSDRKG